MKTYINEKIPKKVSDLTNDSGYLTEHQDISGKADTAGLDALANRVDNIIGGNPGDAELVDIRLKADGTTATTAGNAVREQIGELKENLSTVEDVIRLDDTAELPFVIAGNSHYIMQQNGNVSSETLTNFSYTDYIDVSAFSKISYKRTKHTVATPSVGMAFYTANKTYISGVSGSPSQSSIGYETSLYSLDVPSNAKYARFSTYQDTTTYGNFAVYGLPVLSDAVYNGVVHFAPPAYSVNSYWNVDGETAVLTSIQGYWVAYNAMTVTPGEVFSITAAQGSTHKTRCWIVTDDNNVILSKDDDHSDDGDTPHTSSFTIPENGTKLLLCARNNISPIVTIVQLVDTSVSYAKDQNLTDSEKGVARNNIDAASTSDLLVDESVTSFSMSNYYFWNIETNTAVLTKIDGYWNASAIIPVSVGEKYTVTGSQGPTHKTRIWTVTDDSMNVVSMAPDFYESGNGLHTDSFTVPQGGTKLVLTSRMQVDKPILVKHTTIKNIVQGGLLTGKTVAVIGDSISTNGNAGTDANVPEITVTADDVGVELSAYLTYYDVQAELSLGGHTYTSAEIGTEVTFTPTSDDIGKSIGLPNNYNPNTTTVWWEVMQEKLGNTTIPVCWSGSSITSHEASLDSRKTAHAWHPAQIRKCGIRKPGTMQRTAPDVIIIYRGTNDFSHTPYTLLTDNYFNSYNWEYPTDDTVTGGYGFKEGLCLTVKKLREAYPLAQIWICTMNVFKRINYSHFPTNNGIDSLPQYNDAIREVADFLGCNVIEFDKDGITFENCYSGGYITDSKTIPAHPTDKGHYVMGQKAIADMKAKYNELI